MIKLQRDCLKGAQSYFSSLLWSQVGESSIYLFVAIVPVTMDALFKYWIFKGLNRQSPAAAVTLRCGKHYRCSGEMMYMCVLAPHALCASHPPSDAQPSSSRPDVWHCSAKAQMIYCVLQVHGPALRAVCLRGTQVWGTLGLRPGVGCSAVTLYCQNDLPTYALSWLCACASSIPHNVMS